MGRPRPDLIENRLQDELKNDRDAWYRHVHETFPRFFNTRLDKAARESGGKIDFARSDLEVSETCWIDFETGEPRRMEELVDERGLVRGDGTVIPRRNMGRKITECDPTDSETAKRELAADAAIQLTAAWKRYGHSIEIAMSLPPRPPRSIVSTSEALPARLEPNRDATKQLFLEWARSQQADGEAPPDLAYGRSFEEVQLRCARGDMTAEVEFIAINRRQYLIEIVCEDFFAPQLIIADGTAYWRRWDGQKWYDEAPRDSNDPGIDYDKVSRYLSALGLHDREDVMRWVAMRGKRENN